MQPSHLSDNNTRIRGSATAESISIKGNIKNADNFKISKLTTGIQESTIKQTTLDNNWYTLNGHQLKSKPTSKGIYINNKKKVIIK